ncbi:MAG: PIN domain-containing protein [Coriobacteriales bacterium]|jgi:predicted nucleic acid-binding protein|nr:PIN domain-containing protein [Coriobacteriales bacterium]
MSGRQKVFLDTNILFYAHDAADARKQGIARDLIRDAADAHRILVSTQVLQEFSNACIKKLSLSEADMLLLLDEFFKLDIVQITPAMIKEAVDLHFVSGYSFYDSLILSAAASAGCQVVYTEDMAHGQTVLGVKLLNPFVL